MNGWQALGFNSYQEYLNSDLWKSKRELFIGEKWAENSRCADCGSKNNLCLHHKTYECVGNERQKDLIVLCKKCHKKRHKINKKSLKLI